MSETLYDLKVSLNMSEPLIWRRFSISGRTSLEELHDIIQIVMGWENNHMYQFIINERYYSDDELGTEGAREHAAGVPLESILKRAKRSFIYEYDFANGWEHEVYIEKIRIVDATEIKKYPLCTEGAQACPPEESGGVFGYLEIISALKDPSNESYDEVVKTYGKEFDASQFDVDWINNNLRELL